MATVKYECMECHSYFLHADTIRINHSYHDITFCVSCFSNMFGEMLTIEQHAELHIPVPENRPTRRFR